MAANFGFVVHAAQRYAHVFASEAFGNGFSERCFAYARRSVEAQNRCFQVVAQFQHGQMFDDAFFHFVEPKMVAVENALRFFQVEIIACVFVPRQV